MEDRNSTNYDEFEAGLLKRPEISEEYDALFSKYEIIRRLIEEGRSLE